MDIETLARLIAEKVLAELAEHVERAGCREHGVNGKEAPRVLVFAEASDALTLSLHQAVGSDCSLVYYHKDSSTEGYERYIIPYLCCPNMAALALGQSTSAMTRSVLQLLLGGHEVEVLEFEYERYQTTAPDALYRLYEEYAATLRLYGLIPLNRHAGTVARSRDSLITEKVVKDTARQGYTGLLVPAKAIITDLAKEAALAMNFQLQRAHKEG